MYIIVNSSKACITIGRRLFQVLRPLVLSLKLVGLWLGRGAPLSGGRLVPLPAPARRPLLALPALRPVATVAHRTLTGPALRAF
jgi:hypothetical protein